MGEGTRVATSLRTSQLEGVYFAFPDRDDARSLAIYGFRDGEGYGRRPLLRTCPFHSISVIKAHKFHSPLAICSTPRSKCGRRRH